MQGEVRTKPILFNTAMVQAILDGRKTVTRRVIKPQPKNHYDDTCTKPGYFDTGGNEWACEQCGGEIAPFTGKSKMKAPYQVDDVLWVRETWQRMKPLNGNRYFVYKADIPRAVMPWRPSIHMPKEAARIFLKVTDVRVERLQEIDKFWSSYEKEGMRNKNENISIEMKERFIDVWNSTIKTKNHEEFGWDANPWVFVYEFERCTDEAKKTE